MATTKAKELEQPKFTTGMNTSNYTAACEHVYAASAESGKLLGRIVMNGNLPGVYVGNLPAKVFKMGQNGKIMNSPEEIKRYHESTETTPSGGSDTGTPTLPRYPTTPTAPGTLLKGLVPTHVPMSTPTTGDTQTEEEKAAMTQVQRSKSRANVALEDAHALKQQTMEHLQKLQKKIGTLKDDEAEAALQLLVTAAEIEKTEVSGQYMDARIAFDEASAALDELKAARQSKKLAAEKALEIQRKEQTQLLICYEKEATAIIQQIRNICTPILLTQMKTDTELVQAETDVDLVVFMKVFSRLACRRNTSMACGESEQAIENAEKAWSNHKLNPMFDPSFAAWENAVTEALREYIERGGDMSTTTTVTKLKLLLPVTAFEKLLTRWSESGSPKSAEDFFTETREYYKQYIEATLKQTRARYLADKEALKRYEADHKSSNGNRNGNRNGNGNGNGHGNGQGNGTGNANEEGKKMTSQVFYTDINNKGKCFAFANTGKCRNAACKFAHVAGSTTEYDYCFAMHNFGKCDKGTNCRWSNTHADSLAWFNRPSKSK